MYNSGGMELQMTWMTCHHRGFSDSTSPISPPQTIPAVTVLHIFADASPRAYGTCAYLCRNGISTLVMSKTSSTSESAYPTKTRINGDGHRRATRKVYNGFHPHRRGVPVDRQPNSSTLATFIKTATDIHRKQSTWNSRSDREPEVEILSNCWKSWRSTDTRDHQQTVPN